jgi:hypothetical protein
MSIAIVSVRPRASVLPSRVEGQVWLPQACKLDLRRQGSACAVGPPQRALAGDGSPYGLRSDTATATAASEHAAASTNAAE